MKDLQHIVIIDIEKKDVDKTIELLEDFNFSARFFKAHSAIGLEKILDQEDADLIVLELNLESHQGYKTFKAMLEIAEDIPILVYTQLQNEVIISQTLRAGAIDYLVKMEVSGGQLARAIRNYPIRHQAQVTLASTKMDLAKAKKRSKEAQNIARFGDWTLDIVTGDMTWSDTMYDIFHSPLRSNINNREDFMEMVYFEDVESMNQFFSTTIKTGQLQETTFRVNDGKNKFQYLKARAKVQMFEDIGGLVVVGTCQDITKEIQSQSAIIAQHLAGHGKKLQREMLSHLGFNVRTHLGSLINLFFLFEETVKNKEQKVLLGGMKTSFEDLNDEMHQFLNSTIVLADDLKVVPQKIRLRNFLKSLQSFVQIKESSDLNIEIPSTKNVPDFLFFDGDKLQQIILNITQSFNEISSIAEKPINIIIDGKKKRSAHFSLKITIDIAGYFPFAQDEIIFTNPEEFLAKAATNKETETADTNLAIAARLISLLSGDVDFKTNAKETKISFTIPVVQIEEGHIVNNNKPLYPMHILLVEDHIINQIATKKVLEKWGKITVDIAKNGKIAIEKANSNNYDLILMDIQMPILDGMAATAIIRKSSNLPIIALTAHASDEEKEKCLNIGMNEYITKPFKPKDLYQIINQTVSQLAEKGA